MSTISLTRLNKEYESIIKDPPENFVASPIKDDMFCWHFTIRGPEDSDFEGGLFHGVIKLPTSYPHKPPNVMFLTANGRYDTKMNICLSMTKYHKEEWQAAWTSILLINPHLIVRSMLEAIIAFMPIKEDHEAIGAIDASSDVRKKYAALSVKYVCDTCGPIVNMISPKPKGKSAAKEEKKVEKEKKEDKEDEEQAKSSSSKKSKKKIDQHQRIKAVIVEDSHEDDFEEENKLRKGSHMSNPNLKGKDSDESKPKVADNPDSKSKENDKETVNFIEFFKKMRMDQYQRQSNAEVISDSIPSKPKEDPEEDFDIQTIPPSKKREVKAENKEQPAYEEEYPLNEPNQIDEKTQMLIDELEFQHLMGTIKLHHTKNNEEIISSLKKDTTATNPKSKIEEEFHQCNEKLLTNQKELEKLLKTQMKNMKIYSKHLYEDALKKRLRIMNSVLTVLIVIIFSYFWLIKPKL